MFGFRKRLLQLQIQQFLSFISNSVVAIPVTHTYAYCGHMHSEFLATFCVKMSVHWACILLLHVSKYLRLQTGIIRNTQMPLTKLDRAQIFSESALSFVALFLVPVEMRLYSAPNETNFDHDKCAEFRNSTSFGVPRDYDEWASYWSRRGIPFHSNAFSKFENSYHCFVLHLR